jgi:DNA-directed RNA polymerase delta subunit
MENQHDIALSVVKHHLLNKNSFTYSEIQQEVLECGGILRIGINFTLGEYITELEEDNLIKFNPVTTKYDVY